MTFGRTRRNLSQICNEAENRRLEKGEKRSTEVEKNLKETTKDDEGRSLMHSKCLMKCFYGQLHSKAQEDESYKEIPVGVILDMGSWVGKTVHSCITMAVSDFYMVNSHYKTRIVLHDGNTHGEPLHALPAAFDLLEKTKVQAIIGSDSTSEAKFLAILGDEARIPILSLSPAPSSNKHPYFLQITPDETTQFKGIAATAEFFGWKDLILIYEDTDNGREMATFMTNTFREKSISITYSSLVPTSASNELVQEELHKLSTMQTKAFVLHTSPSLASFILLNAKDQGMMDEGYRWIITSKTMDFMSYMDGEVMESMQGVVGFKSYIPQSRDLEEFTLKWREEYPLMEVKDINTYGIWAHDAVSALAKAVEKQEFDVAIGDISITSNRSQYVDFTLPYTDLGLGILSRNAEKLQSNLPRFVVIVWLFVVLILVSSYTATLSSLLTVEQIKLASKGSSIGYYPNGSPMHGFMVRKSDFDVTRLKPYSTAEEYADALSRGSKKGGVDAIVDEIPYIKEFLMQYPSGYSMVASEAITSGFGFAFPQGSPLAPEISRQITRLREDGTLRMLEDKWFNYQQSGPGLKDSAPK
ncbi:hypothetical protein OSB04_010355, partial [Centaurea solstitialis]